MAQFNIQYLNKTASKESSNGLQAKKKDFGVAILVSHYYTLIGTHKGIILAAQK
jgi:hypothetical protein